VRLGEASGVPQRGQPPPKRQPRLGHSPRSLAWACPLRATTARAGVIVPIYRMTCSYSACAQYVSKGGPGGHVPLVSAERIHPLRSRCSCMEGAPPRVVVYEPKA
jgi:hypothetical protein